MEYFGLIDKMKEYCSTQNNIFIAGGNDYKAYRNALLDNEEYANGQLIVFAGFEMIPTLSMNQLNGLKYTGVVGIGRKCEEKTIVQDDEDTIEDETVKEYTVSNLDETYQQKYDRRLKSLATQLFNFCQLMACNNNLEITSMTMGEKINQYDLNADFVECQITFEQ